MLTRALFQSSPTHALLVLLLSATFSQGCGVFEPPPSGDMSMSVDMPDMAQPADMQDEPLDMQDAKQEVGERCSAPDDCVDGASCVSAAGVFRCMSDCQEPGRICGGGEVCTSTGGAGAVCYLGGEARRHDTCESNPQCAKGLLCFGAEGLKYCLPACYGPDPDCASGEVCVAGASGRGYCRGEVGRSCEVAGSVCDAAGLQCSSQLGGAFDAFFVSPACTAPCEEDSDCGPGAACRDIDDEGTRACLDVCEDDSDCRFNIGEECWSPAECTTSPDPGRCAALTDGANLCLSLP